MIGISKLYCGTVEPSDALRYGRDSAKLPSHLLQFSADKKPVVVWNVTRRCNLRCVHCYAHAQDQADAGELTTREGQALIDDLAAFGVPVVLFSGGEPLMRPDLLELAAYAVAKGMRAVISTNGTLITAEMARDPEGDRPLLRRHQPRRHGSRSTTASAACRAPSARPWTASATARRRASRWACASPSTAATSRTSPASSTCIEDEDIPRVCFYHLVYAGPGLRAGRGRPRTARDAPGRGPDHRPHPAAARPGHAQGSAHRGQPRRRPLPLPAPAEGRPRAGRGGPGAAADERRQQLRPRHRLRELGRRGPRRPVLAPLQLRQRAASGPSPRSGRTPANPLMAQLKDKKPHVKGRCADVPLAGHLRRQLPRAGRGRHRRPLGAGPGLLPDGRGDRADAHATELRAKLMASQKTQFPRCASSCCRCGVREARLVARDCLRSQT